MDFKYTSLILSKIDIAEVDRIYNFYTLEEGKTCAVGRGVRKPNAKLAGNLEPLTQVEIFVSKRRGLGIITGVILANNFSAIKADFSATSRVFLALSYFDKLIAGQEKDEKVFNLLLEYLEVMERMSIEVRPEYKLDLVTLSFLFKLMGLLGYRIRLKCCACCLQKVNAGDANFFSAERGGTLCSECAKAERRKIRNSDSSIKLIRIFLKNKINAVPKLEVSQKAISELELIWKELGAWISG